MGTVCSRAHTIREWPSDERPRERLLTLGPAALAPRELLALVIETGSPGRAGEAPRSAVDLAGDLLRRFPGPDGQPSLRRLTTRSIAEICQVRGMGPAKAARVLAALELGRRAREERRPELDGAGSPRHVFERMHLVLRDLPHEEFHVLLLNTQNQILRDLQISRGTLDATLVHPREVFRAAVAEGAASVIVVHNHPSGDPTPSQEDRTVTRELRKAGDALGIPVLDHVVIGEGRYVSFVEAGLW